MSAPTCLEAPVVSGLRRLAVGVRLAPLAMLVLSVAIAPARADQPADEQAGTTASAAPEVAPPAAMPSSPKSLSERAEDVAAIAIDILLVRPASFAYLGVAGIYFVIVSPLMAATRRVDDSFERLVRTPYAYAVERPIGAL